MQNKEIEEAKECLKETIQNTYAKEKAIKLNNLLQYIEQLETKEQKQIEKKKNQMLEEYKEVIKTNSNKAFYMKCQIEFAEELLKGGENK